MKKESLIQSAVTAFLLISTPQIHAESSSTPPAREKCYGVVKAFMNDCATSKASCAGSAVKNNQPDAFVFVPVGLCDKLVGGRLTPIQKK